MHDVCIRFPRIVIVMKIENRKKKEETEKFTFWWRKWICSSFLCFCCSSMSKFLCFKNVNSSISKQNKKNLSIITLSHILATPLHSIFRPIPFSCDAELFPAEKKEIYFIFILKWNYQKWEIRFFFVSFFSVSYILILFPFFFAQTKVKKILISKKENRKIYAVRNFL